MSLCRALSADYFPLSFAYEHALTLTFAPTDLVQNGAYTDTVNLTPLPPSRSPFASVALALNYHCSDVFSLTEPFSAPRP